MSPIGDGEFDAYRRHVPPSRKVYHGKQWATIAVEAEDIMAAIAEQEEKERREKQAASQSKLSDKNLPDSQPQRSTEKAAELFNTNRTYVNQAAKPHF